MNGILTVLMLCLLLPASSFATQKDPDQVIRYAPVPADPPYQGEVRLLRRDSAVVVQTLLNSKVMHRVVGAIQNKEWQDWPQDKEGSIHSRRYLDELVRAHQIIRDRAKERQHSGDRDRYQQLMIEFVLDEQRSYVALYAPTLTQDGDRLFLQKKELLKKLPLPRIYVHKNMQLIIQDSFQLEADKAIELVGPITGTSR